MAVPALVLVVALYASVATAYLEARRRREPPPRWARLAGALAVAIHLGGLVTLARAIGRSPFATGSQSLSFLAFALAAHYIVLEATSRVASHGGGFYAVAAVLAALSVPGLVAEPTAPTGVHPDVARTVHVGLGLLGTAAVLAGGLLAFGYLGAYRRVKRRTLDDGPGPSLRGFERLARVASVLGMGLLGPALVLGAVVEGRAGVTPTAVVLAVATAVVFAMLAVAGWIWWMRPLRGALAASLNLAATGVVIVAFGLIHPLAIAAGG